MEKQNSNHSAIYFHMGPGFHAKIEAQLFQKSFPHILFIDQPLGLNFSDLVNWAEQIIRKQFKIAKKPLCLLGHSFGGQIIVHVLPRVEECIKEIRLLNSSPDNFDCFANIESALFPQTASGKAFWKKQNAETKLGLILKLAQTPGLNDVYWQSQSSQRDYEALAAQQPPLDVTSFIGAYSEYMEKTLPHPSATWKGGVQIYYSVHDQLIKEASTVTPWRDLFPQTEFIEIPSVGHYAHFESPELAQQFFRP